jgi:glyoxylase-like metal-dependent hydrolase (beta-lactamase superfamily II)
MTNPTRRALIGGVAAGSLASLLRPSAAGAAAPAIGKQAPGFYRYKVGSFECTSVNDGALTYPISNEYVTNVSTDQVIAAAEAAYFPQNMVVCPYNPQVINTGSKLVLIDTGAAKLFGPTLGNLVDNLKAAGYQPEQVDEIYITHMHADHVGGLMAGEKMAFPNAIVRAEQRDADFWLSAANLEKASAEMKSFFQGAQASLNPYVAAGKFKPFNGNTDLVPGVKAVAAPGHTPGHSIYVVESQGQKLVLWGDLMHVAAVQFPEPSVTIQFDTDSKAAAVQRKRAFAEAAKQGYMVGSAHLSFPGLGHLRTECKGYAFVPVNYSGLK